MASSLPCNIRDLLPALCCCLPKQIPLPAPKLPLGSCFREAALEEEEEVLLQAAVKLQTAVWGTGASSSPGPPGLWGTNPCPPPPPGREGSGQQPAHSLETALLSNRN